MNHFPFLWCGMQMASGEQTIAFGHHTIKGKSRHLMEDYYVAEVRKVKEQDLGLFAIYDGHLGHLVAEYLQRNLFDNILKEVSHILFSHVCKMIWTDMYEGPIYSEMDSCCKLVKTACIMVGSLVLLRDGSCNSSPECKASVSDHASDSFQS